MKYRKRPIVIDAVQFDGSSVNCAAVTDFLGGPQAHQTHYWKAETNRGGWIVTLEGDMEFKPGDWIIRGIKGEFYPCKPDIFAATYERYEEPTLGFSHPLVETMTTGHELLAQPSDHQP